jgi:hypothetical protein
LWCRGYKVRYKSAEEGAKPEETYVPSTEDTEQCSLVLEVSPERNQPLEKEILNGDIHTSRDTRIF